MKYFLIFFFVTLSLLKLPVINAASQADSVEADLIIELLKNDQARWSVTYQTSAPVSQLALLSTPNDTRTSRWTPMSDAYAITYDNGSDYVRRADGKPFTKASFVLTPTYTHLPKEYAPFSPFSDGGTLVYSGRFLACIDECADDFNTWSLTLRVPEGDKIIIDGQIRSRWANWSESGKGRNIYVGTSDLKESEHFISVVDPALPTELKAMFDEHMPKLVEQYADRLGARNDRAMAFLSYGEKSSADTYGRQGGVLPGQVFMHWYGNVFDRGIDENEVLRFFSHEVAHLHQGNARWASEKGGSWIHEGVADLMANILMLESLPGSKPFVENYSRRAESDCLEGLAGDSLITATVEKEQYKLFYSCGLAINQAIHDQASTLSKKIDIFTIWNDYAQNIDEGQPTSIETYLSVVKPLVPDDFFVDLKRLVSDEKSDSAAILSGLIEKSKI